MDQASPEGTAPAEPAPFPIVGIGGSAGSLDALQELLGHLPDAPGMAFVVVTHHPEGHRSLLSQILADRTALPVSEARDGEPVEADHVYTIPSDGEWVLRDGRLARARRGSKSSGDTRVGTGRGALHHPVDTFLRSLARDRGSQAIGIILSGTGTDGTVGIRDIKSWAGMVMAQDPESAEFEGMPASAIATRLVDYVLGPKDMPAALVGYVEALVREGAEGAPPASAVDEDTLKELFAVVDQRTGHDFSGYKRSTILRRLQRRMNVHRIDDPDEYIRYLHDNPAEIDLLFKEVIISVTNFFRDAEAWESLAQGPLMERLRAAAAEDGFRAWVVGCASGEEAYTLAILVAECLERLGEPHLPVQIFATDVDHEAIATARAARYPAGIAADVTEERLAKHFTPERDAYEVRKPIRDMVIFAEHNVLNDPPFVRMDLITCRNLLIYLERDLQRKVLPLFEYALRPGGIAFLGPSESPDGISEGFRPIDKHWRIYALEDGETSGRHLPPDLPIRNHAPGVGRALAHGGAGAPRADDFTRTTERLLAGQFAPPSVLLNDRGEVLFVHGHTGRYLEPAVGPVQNQLLDMAREGLRAPLAQALREAAADETEQAQRSAYVQTNDHTEAVVLTVRRIRLPQALRGLRLVTFQAVASLEPVADGQDEDTAEARSSSPGRVERLERELEAARQDKQVTVEELQASNEELQSMNEELQSMNEELQSSNEELEVSKEEVESLNEELRSVNAELEARVGELSSANDDMKNLLDSTQIATVFLDEEMRIMRFTEAARELIALRDSDVDRPIDELSTRFQYADLTSDAEEVLSTLEPKEVGVRTDAGRRYLLRIMPYRTTHQVVRGLVCTFLDVEAIRRLEYDVTYFNAIVQTVREPLLVLDHAMRVVSANEGFYRAFGLCPEAVEGRVLFDLGEGQWDQPALRSLLLEVLPEKQTLEGHPLEADFGHNGPELISINARELRGVGGNDKMILMAINMPRRSGGEGRDGPDGT